MKQNIVHFVRTSKQNFKPFIHDIGIYSIFELIYSVIMTNIRKYQTDGSGWTIDSVIEQNLNLL